MSILWCLTGSLDPRLVSDGRSVDVTFDVETRKSKLGRTAEVSVSGTVNQLPFTVTRRKSSKKSELLFNLDGNDLTNQAVKDTQAIIDDKLGIGSGLLQRCCFFGQHSHIQQVLCVSVALFKE